MTGRVHNGVCKCAVICEYQQSLGILVKSADRVNTLVDIVQKVGNYLSAVRIRHSGHIASRLIQLYVSQLSAG